MKATLKIFFSFLIVASTLLLSGCLKGDNPTYKIDLEIWGPVDDSQVFEEIVNGYKKINPYVGDITYRKMVYDDYKRDVIDALASGQGPDIFLIHNNWLPYFKNKIEPAPDYLLNQTQVQADFVDTVSEDFVSEEKVYALPLSVDSLALYCNKDIFNAQGITFFPSTWQEVEAVVQRLTRIDELGNITQSGIALGTAYNVNRSADILSLLMLQNGTEMTNEQKTEATFNKSLFRNGESIKAGENAVRFYTQFADSGSPYYTWNPRMHYSIDAFSEETVAMMVNYSWQAPAVKLKNSRLDFTIVPVPQIPGQRPVNLAFYMGFAVAKNKIPARAEAKAQAAELADYNKVRIHESWQFIKYLTMRNGGKVTLYNGLTGNPKEFLVQVDPASQYIQTTNHPAARKDLIEGQKNVPLLGAFAYGNLIARSWYQMDPESTGSILAEAIDAINRGSLSSYNALEVAAQRVSQLMGGR